MSAHPRSPAILRATLARWLASLRAAPSGAGLRSRSASSAPDFPVVVCTTQRLRLRHIELADAAFILHLLNEPAFIRFIGDKGARTLEHARCYIQQGPMTSYAGNGFGLYLVEDKQSRESLGICGLVKRESLRDVDLGFAFLQMHWSNGYALESCRAVMRLSRDVLHIERVVAITIPDNLASISLLGKIGMRFERSLRLPGHQQPVSLYVPEDPASAQTH